MRGSGRACRYQEIITDLFSRGRVPETNTQTRVACYGFKDLIQGVMIPQELKIQLEHVHQILPR